ncbi:putative polyprotein of retroviral origin [Ixodes scapularis]
MIDDQLQRLSGARMYYMLDCANGYIQLQLSEESKAKTAFITPDETDQFERMVFGLRNGPAVFQRLMNNVLGTLRNTVALCYMDDLLIPAKNLKHLLVQPKQVLDALRAAGQALKLSKCMFGSDELDYLGFKIVKGYLQPGEVKQQAILEASPPTDVHGVRRIMGLTGFLRRFIPHYALKAEPLTRLIKKDTKFTWGIEQHELTEPPILKLYDPSAPTELHTDASMYGLAGMILQVKKWLMWTT